MNNLELAKRYVRKLVAGGLTVEEAKHTEYRGFTGPAEPGYVIHRGKITVPCLRSDGPQDTFSFADLLDAEIQPDLFGEAAA